ncbi:TonB-dependent siderophore receptor [Rhizobiaceae bacterium BDR2-2]|uniref:TonB-dependent siderophore receptor n=1 Tax=Ectorhizobium quercum TaxID=2965071 RepID=A0AAE3SV54_9HYPH|nr:TonB-dependent siderophore receptor [Ectorhizobium quercum]MCX8997373.1 TonB-dependent siderophore receptor [Ectorhizobium quercum]
MNGTETIVKRRHAGKLARILLGTTVLAGMAVGVHAQDARNADDPETVTELGTIVVEGSTYDTEGTGSYTTNLISVGDKDTRPLREVPQSTTVLTRERLEDGNFTSLDTALRKTPGVVVLANDDGRSSLFSRGFEVDSLYLNGLSTPEDSIYGTQPDMATIDHVEILRGPSGLFGGAGEPGSAINMRLKQASDEYKASVNTIMSSWDGKRIEADVTGPLTKSGRVRGRLVGALSTKDHWVDVVDNKVGVFYGTVQADLTDNTTATVSVNHRQRHITPFNGLPAFSDGTLLDLDRSTFVGADWNDFSNRITDYIAELEHRFEDGGHAKISALYSRLDADFLYGFASGAVSADGSTGMRWLARDFERTALSLDAHISKPVDLYGMESNVILGMDYRSYDTDMLNAAGTISGVFNVYDWNSAVDKPTVNYTTRTETDPWQFGIYGQYRIKPVDRLTLIGGARLSWYDASSTVTTLSTGNAETSKVSENAEVTPYAGIIYDLTDRISAYASYTEIFKPQENTDVDGNMIGSRTGRQYEAGFKAELLDGVNGSIAYFNLLDKNRAISDISNPGSYLAQGEANMQGLELEVSGTVLPGWEVMAGYTYTDTEFTSTETAAGSEFYTPEHMVQLWTKYTFEERGDWTDGIFIGGGLKVFSSFKNIVRTAAGGATDFRAPGYAVVDLQAGYKFNEHVTASLTVGNVFDRKYYERIGSATAFNFYGEPRNVTFKLGTTF